MIVTNCQIFSQLFVFPAFMHNPQLDLFNVEAEEDVIFRYFDRFGYMLVVINNDIKVCQ